MMRFVMLCLLAACTFEKAVSSSSGDDAPVIDAPPDTAICAGPDSDGDGVNDPCDKCPQDSPDDSDGDGVCNSMDACAAGPDDEDEDGDAIADACDDWPCGVKPASPAASVTWQTPNENVTLSMIDVQTMGQRAVVSPGAVFPVAARYSIVDCQCTGCIDQIEIGFHDIGKAACLYNGNPGGSNCNTPTTGAETRMVTAPMTPGVYQLRFNRGNDNTCQNNGAWWDDTPPGAGNTFALVCVK
jgi:hypothetical protein